MKERPILFSGAMVRAILGGSKTQTRRIVKLGMDSCGDPIHATDPRLPCPYGQPGDRLWVRETFGIFDSEGTEFAGIPKEKPRGFHVVWAADCPAPVTETFRFRPSIHMPRWASRITLEVTAVRVERLQEISEEDAKAEGVTIQDDARITSLAIAGEAGPAQLEYFALWQSINGPGSWAANPFVWVVEFRRL